MHDGVGCFRRCAIVIAFKAEMGGEGVEDLATVGDVGDQRVHVRMVERLEIDVQDLVALRQQMRHGMATGLAGATSEMMRLVMRLSVSLNSSDGPA